MFRTSPKDDNKIDTIQMILAAALGLISFGLAYAWLVNRLERSGHMENRSSWFVALGTAVTVFVRHASCTQGRQGSPLWATHSSDLSSAVYP